MSSQSDVNFYPHQFILYYCGSDQKDSTVYDTDLSDVCTIGYDGSDNLTISSWLIGGYSAPSNATLRTFALATVLAWYDNFYAIPAQIRAGQTYQISSASLAAIRSGDDVKGCVVYETTTPTLRTWDGSTWFSGPDKFILRSGANTMTGALNMNSNAINNATTITQTTPVAQSLWSSDSVSVSFTADTPKVIDITGFTDAADPASSFTVSTSTGQVTYTGATTRYFRVAINYSSTKLSPLTTQTFTTYISKNGSTTINGKRIVQTFNLGSLTEMDNHCLSGIVQLAQNDTVQLGGQYTATTNITISNVSYDIAAL